MGSNPTILLLCWFSVCPALVWLFVQHFYSSCLGQLNANGCEQHAWYIACLYTSCIAGVIPNDQETANGFFFLLRHFVKVLQLLKRSWTHNLGCCTYNIYRCYLFPCVANKHFLPSLGNFEKKKERKKERKKLSVCLYKVRMDNIIVPWRYYDNFMIVHYHDNLQMTVYTNHYHPHDIIRCFFPTNSVLDNICLNKFM